MLTRRRFMQALALAPLAGLWRGAAAAAPQPLRLRRQFARIEAASGGRLGVAMLDLRTGLHASHRGGERFPMCSTWKVLAVAAMLQRVDAGQERLDRRIRFDARQLVSWSPVTERHVGGEGMRVDALCAAALEISDNTAANLLLEALGGPAAITQFARGLGDRVTRLDRYETALNEATPGDPRDTTAPDAMAGDLRRLLLGDALHADSRARLLAWMEACRTGDGQLRAGVPAHWRVADKTGSGGYGSSNDVGLLMPPGQRPVVVAVYLTQTQVAEAQRHAAIAAVARAIVDTPWA
ncbi:class A beta-lactamase [Metallibacterium scheffleri]